ncbi:MAG: hypothetical protein IH903_00340 [Proteobacteria bacterium]|nr:hypothetical protein [Pseudomonadota bacterium]
MGLKPVFRLAAVAFAFTMAACAGPPPGTPPPSTSGVETAKAGIETPVEATRRGALMPKAPAPEAPAKAKKNIPETPPPPETRTANVAPPVNPRRIMGLTRAQLSDLLGKPHFRRRDVPAEIWQYRHPECILDVFLYQSGDDYRVLHFEMRQGKAEAASRTRCLAAHLNARARNGAG